MITKIDTKNTNIWEIVMIDISMVLKFKSTFLILKNQE